MVNTAIVVDDKQRIETIKSEIDGHFLRIGQLLCEVENNKLYLVDKEKSFSQWVKNKLGYSAGWASQHKSAYRQNQDNTDGGALPFYNISAARKMNTVIADSSNIDAISIALLASEIAQDDGRRSLNVGDINQAYQLNVQTFPPPVQDFCFQWGISNPDKVKIISEWYSRGKDRDESKWESMRYSGKLIINYAQNDKDDLILDLSTCTAPDMTRFESAWRSNIRNTENEADPNRQIYDGSIADIIKKLFKYRHKRAHIIVKIKP